MSFGIIEVITLLLGMAGFGLQPNPRAPTAEQALQYGIADADIVAHIDAASVIPGNYKLLGQLADQPQIRASAETQKLVREVVGEVEGARGIAKLATGIDLASDVADATAFVQLAPGAEPRFVIAAHGKFSASNLEKIGKAAGGAPSKVDAGAIVELGAPKPAIGLTKDGVMLVGTPDLVRDRLAGSWKAPSHAAGTNLGYAADVIGEHPVFAIAVTMSRAARGELLKQLSQAGFANDLVTRHKLAALSLYHNGVGWTWIDSSKPGLDAIELVSSGVIDFLRSAQIGPRGIAKILLGALDSYRGVDPRIDELIKHKAELTKLVDAYTSDGSFKAAVDKNPKTLKLSVRATGKTASEVVPFGLVMPAAALGYLAARAETAAAPAIAVPDRPAPAGKPAAAPPAAKPPVAKPPAAKPPVAKPPARK